MSDKEKVSENTTKAPQDEKPNDEPEVLRFPPEEEAVSINYGTSYLASIFTLSYYAYTLLM